YLDPRDVSTTQTYDGANRVLTKVVTKELPNNGGTELVSSEVWTYDGNGNVLTYLDPRNVLTTNTYDGANRTTSTVLTIGNAPPFKSEFWTYDDNGNVLT